VEAGEAKRSNIPTAELEKVMEGVDVLSRKALTAIDRCLRFAASGLGASTILGLTPTAKSCHCFTIQPECRCFAIRPYCPNFAIRCKTKTNE